MPLGAVMFFRAATCPEGWSELAEATGRTLVGLSPGGKLEATVGDRLGDLENRAHGHSIGPIVATTSEAPAHSHVIDPPARRTFGFESARVRVIGALDSSRWISVERFHSHIVDILPFDSSARGQHAHGLTVPARQATAAAAGQVMPYIQLQACRNDSATTPAMPAGAVTFFDLASCPSGWSELAEARGRTVVGASSRGAVQGTVGDPLGDLEDRAHSHTVGSVSVTTTVSEIHAHAADPSSVPFTSSVDSASVKVQGDLFNTVRWIEDAVRHSHQLDHGPLNVSVVAGHAHQVTIPQAQSTVARTGQVMPYVQLLACRNDSPTTPAMPAGAVTFFSLAGCSAGWSEMTEARGRALVGLGSGGALHGTVGDALGDVEDRTHTHAFGQINLSTSVQPAHLHHISPQAHFEYTTLSASGSGKVEFGTDEYAYILNVETHQHEFQFLADGFDSLPAGEHAHSVTVSPVQTGAARTSDVMPYLQLLACRKG